MLDTILLATALLSLLGWIHLRFLRGGFWRSDQRLSASPPPPAAWPMSSPECPTGLSTG